MADNTDTILGLLDEVGKTEDKDIRMLRLRGARTIVRKMLGKATETKKPKIAQGPRKAVKKNRPAVDNSGSK